MKIIAGMIFFALLLVWALVCFSVPSAAQALTLPGSCYRPWACSVPCQNCACTPLPPPTAILCGNVAPFAEECFVPTSTCAPPNAGSETGSCPSCAAAAAAAAAAGHPIGLATGNTYIEETDLKVPGLSNGLALDRTWNSKWPPSQSGSQVGRFGPNWRSTYEERVFVGSDGYMKYARSDGSFWSFGFLSSSGSIMTYKVAAPANAGGATLATGASFWTLTFQNGEQRLFDNASGNIIKIIDRNGNATQISYDSSARLGTITDAVSRHLNFTYLNSSSTLITGVTTDVGLSLTYTYDAQGRLTQVTRPDLSTISFEYDANSLITAVKDSQGKILESHTYDSSARGLTSSRANGVDSVTISYPH